MHVVMKIRCLPSASSPQEVNVVYQHTCTVGGFSRFSSRYIGVTTTTLSKNYQHPSKMAQYADTIYTNTVTSHADCIWKTTIIIEIDNDIKRLKRKRSNGLYWCVYSRTSMAERTLGPSILLYSTSVVCRSPVLTKLQRHRQRRMILAVAH